MSTKTMAKKVSTNAKHMKPEVEALEWLADKVTRSQTEPFGEVVVVTPTLAKVMLDLNQNNRKISEINVNRIAHDIKKGNWVLNGEPIIVSREGELNDGQHRLWAILKANVAVQSFMTFGLDRESRMTVDTGIARTVASFMAMQGAKNTTRGASLASYLTMWMLCDRNLLPASTLRPTKQDVLDVYTHYQHEIDTCVSDTARYKTYTTYGSTALLLAYLLFRRIDRNAAVDFVDRLMTGHDLPAFHPILTLRNRLIEDRQKLRTDPNSKMELIVRAWNMVRRGQATARTIPLRGEIPVIEK